MRIEAQFDPRELDKMRKALKKAPGECEKGLVSAINRSVKTTNTAMQKAVTERYNIKKGDLSGGSTFKGEASNNLIKPIYAKPGALRAALWVRGSRLALVAKRRLITPTAPKSHKGKTMRQIKRIPFPSVKVVKGKKTRYPHSFVAQGRGGTIGLFSRGKTTGKLTMQRTLSVANMVRYPSVQTATKTAASEALQKNAQHEIEYRLSKVMK